jgi:hypothetical protein
LAAAGAGFFAVGGGNFCVGVKKPVQTKPRTLGGTTPVEEDAEITVEQGERTPTQKFPPPTAKKPAPAAAKGTHLSEPEIQISELVEMVADEPEPEPADDVIELVAADMEEADAPRAKRQSDAPE